jgi:site-specific DNA-cytosine methylase
MRHVQLVLDRFAKANLKIVPSKCDWGQLEIRFLGHLVSYNSIKADPAKTSAVTKFPRPQTVKQVQAFLGMANFFRQYIPHFADIAAPLYLLTQKGAAPMLDVWGEKEDAAFEQLKQVLVSPPVLRSPDFTKMFYLHTDYSGQAIGAVLTQEDEDGNHYAIGFASRILHGPEQRYSATEGECLAIMWHVEHFRAYIHGHQFHLITNHSALQFLLGPRASQSTNRKHQRWAIELQSYDFTISYRQGSKHVVPDALSRCFSAHVCESGELSDDAFEVCESHLPAVAQAMNEWAVGTAVDSAAVSYVQVLETELRLPAVAAASALPPPPPVTFRGDLLKGQMACLRHMELHPLDVQHALCVLELCAGMGTGVEALLRAGFCVNHYIFVEADADARELLRHRLKNLTAEFPLQFPASAYKGQFSYPKNVYAITPQKLQEFPPIDIVLAGPPCQGFSRAGPQGMFSDKRSLVFAAVVDLIAHIHMTQPQGVAFLLENVPDTSLHPLVLEALGTPVILDAPPLGSLALRKTAVWQNFLPQSVLLDEFRKQSDAYRRGAAGMRANSPLLKMLSEQFAGWEPQSKDQIVLPKFVCHPASHQFREEDGVPRFGMLRYLERLMPPSSEIREVCMGFPRGSTDCGKFSDDQRCRMLGNAWDLNMFTWVFSLAVFQTPRICCLHPHMVNITTDWSP